MLNAATLTILGRLSMPNALGPCFRVAGNGVRPCFLRSLSLRGFVTVSNRAHTRWSSLQVTIPEEDVFKEHAGALDEYRRRRAARRQQSPTSSPLQEAA